MAVYSPLPCMFRTQNEHPRPGVEVVCDDGVCSQCVRAGPGPRLPRREDTEPEDWIMDGFVCAEELLEDSDAERVCDDGHCVGCKVSRHKNNIRGTREVWDEMLS